MSQISSAELGIPGTFAVRGAGVAIRGRRLLKRCMMRLLRNLPIIQKMKII